MATGKKSNLKETSNTNPDGEASADENSVANGTWRDVQRQSEEARDKNEDTDPNPAHQDIVNAAQVGRTTDEDLSVGLTLEEQRKQGVAEKMRKNVEEGNDVVEPGSEDPDDSFLRPEGQMPEDEAKDNLPGTGELTAGDNGTNNTRNRKTSSTSKSSK